MAYGLCMIELSEFPRGVVVSRESSAIESSTVKFSGAGLFPQGASCMSAELQPL